MKVTAHFERMWFLEKFYGRGGWSSHPLAAKKWKAHEAKLIRDGFLEEGDYGLCRITEKGIAALGAKEG